MESVKEAVGEFYDQASIVAASLGIIIDLLLLPAKSICLDMMGSLAINTGGSIWLYPSVAEATLTQDLFRHFSLLHGQNCLLRVRVSSEVKISKSFGRLMKDPVYEDLYHVLSCDPYETFCFDLEHMEKLPPALFIQVAFQYNIPVFVHEEETQKFELQKRLRIATIHMDALEKAEDLYKNINSEVVVQLLLHKVMIAEKAEGMLKAVVLLQDWLILLAASYEKQFSNQLVWNPEFLPIIRMIYGLLRSPLLLGSYPCGCIDQKIFIEHMWKSLPSTDLQRALYPNLMAFNSPNTKVSVSVNQFKSGV